MTTRAFFHARTLAFALAAMCLGVTVVCGQFGKVMGGPFDLSMATGGADLRGIEFGLGADPRNPMAPMREYLWVSGIDRDGVHSLYQIDVHAPGGPAQVGIYPAPFQVNSTIALYDLAHDGTNNLIYVGTDDCNGSPRGTILAFDCANLLWDAGRNILVDNVTSPQFACLRALAFEPSPTWTGPVLYVADGSSDIIVHTANPSLSIRCNRFAQAQHWGYEIHGLAFLYIRNYRILASFGRSALNVPPGSPGAQVVLGMHHLGGSCYRSETTLGDVAIHPAGMVEGGGQAAGLAHAFDTHYGQEVLWCLQKGQADHAVPIDPTWYYGSSSNCGPDPWMPHCDGAPQIGNSSFTLGILCSSRTQVALFMGTSASDWRGLKLPYHLAAYGMPGCYINVGLELYVGAQTASQGYAFVSTIIPANLCLRGATVFAQFLVLDSLSRPITSTGVGFVIK